MNELVILDEAERRLAEIETVEDVKHTAHEYASLERLARDRKIDPDTRKKIVMYHALTLCRGGELVRAIPRVQGDRSGQEGLLSTLERSGIRESVAYRWQLLAELGEDAIRSTVAESNGNSISLAILYRMAAEKTPAKEPSDSATDRATLFFGDCRERYTELPEASVDLIVTDPPYEREALPLWTDLSRIARYLLAPRGILFAWTGQLYLPEVLDRLREHLRYGWTFALQLPGSGSRIMGRHIIQAWKPVLAFTKGTWPSGEWADDWLISPAREKDKYQWQQNGEPARRLIERYSRPNALVVDPFLGVGSFGNASLEAGRRFVGMETDAGRFETAKKLLS